MIDIICFTPRGRALAERISAALDQEARIHFDFGSVNTLVAGLFPRTEALVFVGAAGIAVRSIAPHVKDKLSDPAVLVCDEAGKFVISLLSGHVGGANSLTGELAEKLGAQAVITTATDVNGVFSVDEWAVRNGFAIETRDEIKAVSGALLRGDMVGFFTELPIRGDIPKGLELRACGEVGVYVGGREGCLPFEHTLVLRPKNLVLGIGCRRGASREMINATVLEAFSLCGLSTSGVCAIGTIDLKKDEAGLLDFGRSLEASITFYCAQELRQLRGEFSHSDYVQSVTGVGNVCDRAATLLGGKGRLLLKKHASNGVTVSIFEREGVSVSFYV